jgi:hypothetical protein
MTKNSHSITQRPSAPERIAIPNHEPESENERSALHFSTKKDIGHIKPEFYKRLRRLTPETPKRPPLTSASIPLSIRSSSTISSIFSTNSHELGTPLTPPLLETSSFVGFKNARGDSHDKTSRILFSEKDSRAVGQSSIPRNLPEPDTIASSEGGITTPDLPMDDMDCMTVVDEDELASCLDALSLNSSPVAQQTRRRKKLYQVLETADKVLGLGNDATIPNGKFGPLTPLAPQQEITGGKKRNAVPSAPIENTGKSETRHCRSNESHHSRSRSLDLEGISIHTKLADSISDIDSTSLKNDERSVSLPVLDPGSIMKKKTPASSSVPKICSTPSTPRRRSGSAPGARKLGPPIETSDRSSDEQNLASSTSGHAHTTSAEIGDIPPVLNGCVAESLTDPKEKIPDFQVYDNDNSEPTVRLGVLSALRCADKPKQPKSQALSAGVSKAKKEISYLTVNGIKKSKEPDNGFIYVYRCQSESFPPGYVKIGKTKQPLPKERLQQLEKKCKIKVTLISDPDMRRFRDYGVVEKIIHAELRNERRTYTCWCGKSEKKLTTHNEWFEIEEKKAIKVVEGWRRWAVDMRPYRKDGSLRACWIWKHDKAMNEKGIDWAIWQEFSWLETVQCCCHCLHMWMSHIWPTEEKLSLTPELFALGFAIVFPLYVSGLGIQSGVMFLAILGLYLYLWFNYS